jgi:hypothetical protein
VELVYRALGLVALWSERMSRTRGNGIPMNWWVMLIFVMCLFGVGTQVREAMLNDSDTPHLTLAEAANRDDLLDRRVAVKGKLALEHALTFHKTGDDAKEPDRTWVPLIDPGKKRAMYVQIDLKDVPADDLREEWATGMLRTLDRDLKSDLMTNGREIDGIIPDGQHMIVAGERPARLWIWLPIGAVPLLALLAMLVVVPLRYTIFRPTRETWTGVDLAAAANPAEQQPSEMRVSGRFALTPTDTQRFLNTPSAIAELETGETALVSNIDASVNQMGTVERRAGLWVIVLAGGTLAPPEYGWLYLGLKRHPAMRLRFTDGTTHKPSRVLLSFPTTVVRDRVREVLYDAGARKRVELASDRSQPASAAGQEGGPDAV